jgi:hypothetical protein
VRKDSGIEFAVQDTTDPKISRGDVVEDKVHINSYTIEDGEVHDAQTGKTHDMANSDNLAAVRCDHARQRREEPRAQTWIDLAKSLLP